MLERKYEEELFSNWAKVTKDINPYKFRGWYYSKLIREKRKQKSLTRVDLANAINVSPKTIEAWEEGLRRPSLEKSKYLSFVFGEEPLQYRSKNKLGE